MENLLHALGVRPDTLNSAEKAFLDQNGYLNLGKLLSDEDLERVQQRITELLAEEGENAGRELAASKYIRHPKEAGADRLADLVNKGAEFDIFYTHPRVLAAIAHVVQQPFKLSSLNYRAAKPGMGLQKLHADSQEAVAAGHFKVCNSIWLLDDFSKANGATRIVPGTHLSEKMPQDVLEDPWATHPHEIIIEAEAGTVVIFNSHTWHGGTTNRTDRPRRAIHSYFCRHDVPQQIDQQRYILPETRARIGEAAQRVLDV